MSDTNNAKLLVDGISCASCVSKIERALAKVDGVEASVNLVNSVANVDFSDDVSLDEIITRIENLGYGVQVLESSQPQNTTLDISTEIERRNSSSSEAFTSNTVLASEGADGMSASPAEGQPETSNINTGNSMENAGHKWLNLNGTKTDNTSSSHRSISFDNLVKESTKRFKISANSTVTQITPVKLVLTFVASAVVMALSMSMQLHFSGYQFLVAILATLVGLLGGSVFHIRAFRAIRHLNVTMDTLVSMSVIVSLLWSWWQIAFNSLQATHSFSFLSNQNLVYFDTACMITSFVLLGRFLEDKAKRKGKNAIDELLKLGAKEAKVLVSSSQYIQKPIDQIKVGDVLLVQSGEKVPADGTVVKGESEINTSMLTGETLPKVVGIGDEVVGGTINNFGTIHVEVTKTNEQSLLAEITKTVLQVQTQKAPIQKLVDKVTMVFVPVVIVISAVSFLLSIYSGNTAYHSVATAVAVLVIACPCALGLATPMALIVATGSAARKGILIKNLEVIENTAKLGAVVFDKTGTVTTGDLKVESVYTSKNHLPDYVLGLANGAEMGSTHPIAKAINQCVSQNTQPQYSSGKIGIVDGQYNYGEVNKFINHIGCGVEAEVGDIKVFVGKPKWIKKLGGVFDENLERIIAQTEYTGAVISAVCIYNPCTDTGFDPSDLEVVGIIVMKDQIRANAKATIRNLKKNNITPYLVTGDNHRNASHVATRVGIEENNVYANTMPITKKEIVESLQEKGNYVAMIGDGINDAVALTQASVKGVSYSIASGSDIAIHASDVTFINDDISLLNTQLKLSLKTSRIIRQNLLWAFCYNIVAIPMAVLGYVNPALAGLAMIISSLTVTLNSLRLRKIK